MEYAALAGSDARMTEVEVETAVNEGQESRLDPKALPLLTTRKRGKRM